MSKTLGSIALATLVTIGLTACGGGKPSFDECKEQGVDAPTWVCIPEVAGGIAAVGSAQKSPAGTGFQRQEAMANGRDALARQIAVKVKNMFKNFTQATGVGDEATVEKMSSNVSKQVANQTLSGTAMKGRWIAPDGTMYVLIVLDPTAAVAATKAKVQTSLRNEKALWQQFQAKKAQAELDAEIEKEMGQAPKM